MDMTDKKLSAAAVNLARLCLLLLLLWAGLGTSAADARPILAPLPTFEPLRTLYVSPAGDDQNDGLSEDRPFRTISAAAQAVQPGDLVLVFGGTYFEHVHLTVPGTEEHPIVFRAVPGETALVTFGQLPTGWQSIPGTRAGYIVAHDTLPNYVMDQRHTARYARVYDQGTLDQTPGSFLYDQENRTLAVHPLRSLHPDVVRIRTIAYSPLGAGPAPGQHGYEFDKGFWLRARHNRVEGFHVAWQPMGIQLRADFTEAWNNVVYGNATIGMAVHNGKHAVMANNRVFLNDGSGLHASSQAEHTRVLGNTTWGNSQRGPVLYRSVGGHEYNLAFYGRVYHPVVEGNLVIGGQHPLERGDRVARYKSVYDSVITRHNVFVGGRVDLGWAKRSVYENNTAVHGKLINRGAARGNITAESAPAGSQVADNLYLTRQVEQAGFADPVRHDYRLHAGSPHLGIGAWPDAAAIRYVSPAGDDQATGRTPQQAWQTITHAAEQARPGDTIYIMPGIYREQVHIASRGESEQPIAFLTHGRGDVILQGGSASQPALSIAHARHVTIDGLIVKQTQGTGIAIDQAQRIELLDCVIDGPAVGVQVQGSADVTVQNVSLIACGQGIELQRVSGRIVLRNNLLVRSAGPLAVMDPQDTYRLISERNAFAGRDAQQQLADWQSRVREAHPSMVANVDVAAPDYRLPALSRYSFMGIGHRPLGARGEAADQSPIEIASFELIHQGPNRAVVQWTTPSDYTNAQLTWIGADGESRRQIIVQDDFSQLLRTTTAQAAVDGLEPANRYEVTLEVWTADGRTGQAKLSFESAAAHPAAPRTLHVDAVHGDDANAGLSPSQAFRTLGAAVAAAHGGDTILAAPGVYPETVHLLHGGVSQDRRLTLRSIEPGGAVIDLGVIRSSGIHMQGVEHITIDGFRFDGLEYSSIRGGITVIGCEDVEITNCIYQPPVGRDSVSIQLVLAYRSQGLHIHNNLFRSGFHSIQALGVDRVTIHRNTFYLAGVTAVRLSGQDDATFRVTENIFYDVSDRGVGAIDLAGPVADLTVDRNLYYRGEQSKMGLVSFRRDEKGKLLSRLQGPKTVEALQQAYGLGQYDRMGDPLFVDAENGDFRLAPDSPARTMAADGGPIGMRQPGQ